MMFCWLWRGHLWYRAKDAINRFTNSSSSSKTSHVTLTMIYTWLWCCVGVCQCLQCPLSAKELLSLGCGQCDLSRHTGSHGQHRTMISQCCSHHHNTTDTTDQHICDVTMAQVSQGWVMSSLHCPGFPSTLFIRSVRSVTWFTVSMPRVKNISDIRIVHFVMQVCLTLSSEKTHYI